MPTLMTTNAHREITVEIITLIGQQDWNIVELVTSVQHFGNSVQLELVWDNKLIRKV
jgi:biotin synthase-related radical SAM superfamily protein